MTGGMLGRAAIVCMGPICHGNGPVPSNSSLQQFRTTRAQEQTARYAATLAYVRTLEDGIPQSWEHVHYTRPEVDQAEAVITWHGDLIRSYAVQAASEKVTRLANETITMLREKREKVAKDDGSIAARNVIARLGKGEMRTDAGLREQVLEVLVSHRHLIPTTRKGHYMMVVPNI